jgi:futalosine hydrolase
MSESRSGPLALVCSVALEAEPLLRSLRDPRAEDLGTVRATRGRLHGAEVLVLAAGMGKTNAAHGLTVLLERVPARGVIGFGVGGAYPGSGLGVGDLALAASESYGDEGAATPDGWISTREIGIPLLERGGERTFNDLPLDADRVERAAAALRGAGLRVRVGPFVTVSCCSGTAALGAALAGRFGALCESMEGAAYAHVAALYGLPFLEVRGISNLVEDRDLSRWDLRTAAAVAAEAAAALASAF